MKISEPKCIWDAKALLGESPLWAKHEQALYWVDIKAPAIHRIKPETGDRTSWPMPEKIGCLVHKDGTGFLAALSSGFVELKFGPAGTQPVISLICNPEANLPGNRFNDGKLDPAGRFWAGTMDDAEEQVSGNWWQLDEAGGVQKIDAGYKVTNGPAFDPARKRVYLTDSAAQTIFAAELSKNGTISNKRVFKQFTDGDGYPDGMTTDSEGNLWVAFWDGACIRRFMPDGTLDQEVPMPVPRPTSLAFGPCGKTLYVTSARIDLSHDELEQSPLSGGLFVLRLEK